MARFKHLATLRTSCAARDERPYVALEHIESWTGALIKGTELPVRTPSRTGMASVQPGDVLFGKLRPYLAKTWVVDRPALASTELMCMRPQAGVDSRWLGYSTLATPFVEWAVATSEGTKMPRTSWEKVGEYRPWVPSPSEQRAIADYLDTETSRIDTLITKKRRMIELIQERRTAMIDEYVGSVDGPLIAMRHLSSHITSGPRGWAQYTSASGTVFLRITNIDRSEIHLDMSDTLFVNAPQTTESLRTEVRGGDVLVSITADIGSVGIVPETLSGAHISQHVALVRPNQETRTRWLAYAIKSTPSQIQLDSGQYGGTKTQLSLGDIAGLRVPCPHLRVQDHILRKLEPAIQATSTAIRTLHRQIALLTERRQALITETVTGELAVLADRG